jgi:hypothetical protein
MIHRVYFFALVAFAALSGVAAATASAELPEFNPGAAGTKLTAKSGAGTLSTAAKGTFECMSDTATGELIGTDKNLFHIHISESGCKAFGIIGAKSLGDTEGDILILIDGHLCYVNKAKKEVGVLSELTEAVHVEVAGKLLKLSGAFVAAITPINVKDKTFTIVYKQKGGTQEPVGCEGKTENLKLQENETGAIENAALATTEAMEFTTIEQTLAA